jgi:hypothetical protein
MDYKVCETCLFLPISLTRSECAAWVQAWGTILAILGAFGVAFYQSNRSFKIAMTQIAEERRQDHVRTAETLSKIAQNTLKLQKFISAKLNSRTEVHEAAEFGLPFDMPALRALERSIDGIQLHELPASLVGLSLILSSTVRQFRMKVEMAFANHHKMDAGSFDDFFKTLNELNQSLELTVADFDAELIRVRYQI